jgi:hypothetical protein
MSCVATFLFVILHPLFLFLKVTVSIISMKMKAYLKYD